jgi:hypothetical protein
MIIKLEFYDPKKNNATWWNKLFDRIPKSEDRDWVISSGGCKYGTPSVEFDVWFKKKPKKDMQSIMNEVVLHLVLEQTNVQRVVVDGNDLTKTIVHR